MRLLNFYRDLEVQDRQLLQEFCWILEEKFSLNSSLYLSGSEEINEQHQKVLLSWFQKKSEDYPLQYFLNSTAFLDLDFYVEEGVLIPRMETEDIVLWILDYYQTHPKPHRILDIGSGSGCMGLSLKMKLEPQEVFLVEPFKGALKSLNRNTNFYGDEKTLIKDEKFEDFEASSQFDLIVSNPPYIKYADPEVADGVYKFEPHEALYGGDLGYETPVNWFLKAEKMLSPGGLLVFEMSYDQKENLQQALSEFNLEFKKDRFGKDRFFFYEKRENHG